MNIRDNEEIIDSLDLFPAMELEVQIIRLGNGEQAVRFVDCTGLPPTIYKWCLEDAIKWLNTKDFNV